MAVKLGNGKWAIKEDKLLAYNDNSGRFFNKEFDFSRGSSATYVAKDGLIKTAGLQATNLVNNGDFSELGSELIINGNFDTDSDWNGVNANGTSISNGSLNYSNTSLNHNISQGSVVTIGKPYQLIFTISNYEKGSILPILGAGGVLQEVSGDGTYTMYGTASINETFYFQARGTDGTTLSIDNVSVKEVGQNWTLLEDVSIGNGVATFLDSGSNPNTRLIQSNILTSGKSYKLTFEVTRYVSGRVQVLFGTSTTLILDISSGVGTYTIYGVSDGTDITIKRDGGFPNFDFDITNVSVKEVGQNWTVTNGNISDKYNASMTAYQSGIKITPFVKTGTYKVVFDLVVTSGSCKFDAGGGNDEIYTTSGTKEILITNPIKFEFNAFNLGWVGSLDNVSVIEITDDTDLPRINYTNFDYEDVLGDELVTNGYYEQSGIGNVISQSGGVLVNENNQLKISSNGSSAYSRGVWATGGLEGDTFLVEADIISTSGSVRFYDQSNNGTYTDLVVGSRYQRYIVLGSNDKNLGFGGNNDVNFELVLDNVSIKKFTGNVVVPYSGTGSLLLEPQSTNLVTYSEDFSQYTASVVTLESGYLAPDGSNNAYKASGTIGTSALYIGGALPTATRTIYAKTVSGTGQAHLCSFNANTNNLFTITEDWQRFEVNGTTINAGETNFYAVDFRGSTNLSEVIIWGGQVEELSYATSYIVSNSGSTTTRLADVCNNAGSSDLINSTEGVLYAEISALANDGTKRYISLSDGSNSNDVRLYFDTGGYISALTKVGGSTQAFLQTNAYTQTDFNKIAFKYKENNFSLYVNGIEVATDNLGSVNTANTLNQLAFFGNLLPFYGNVKTVAVFDYLDNDQLERLTGEGYESFNLLAQANNYTII